MFKDFIIGFIIGFIIFKVLIGSIKIIIKLFRAMIVHSKSLSRKYFGDVDASILVTGQVLIFILMFLVLYLIILMLI